VHDARNHSCDLAQVAGLQGFSDEHFLAEAANWQMAGQTAYVLMPITSCHFSVCWKTDSSCVDAYRAKFMRGLWTWIAQNKHVRSANKSNSLSARVLATI